MKKVSLVVLALFCPLLVIAGEAEFRFLEVKHVDQDHFFAYQCTQNQNIIEEEQRYNKNSKSEEIRFWVDQQAGEWITKGISPELFRYFAVKSCKNSTSATISWTKP